MGYALFVAERSEADDVEAIYFLTREGEFFKQVFTTLLRDGRLGRLTPPRASLLEVSRLSTFAASLRAVTPDEMRRLWTLYDSQSFFAFASSLGLDPLELAPFVERRSLPLMDDVVQPWRDPRVQALFRDPGFVQLLSDKIAADRQALLTYLNAQGFVSERGSRAVVDIGWRGTIQDNLALLHPRLCLHGYYLGLQRFRNPQPPNVRKWAYGPNANQSLRFIHLLDAISPMEMLCNSPHGSVIGYRAEAGRMMARRQVEPPENAAQANVIAGFQRGVLDACRYWADEPVLRKIGAQDLRDWACRLWSDLIVKPEPEFVATYAGLKQDDVFGVGGFVDKRLAPSPRQLFRAIVFAGDRRAVVLYIKQTQWAAGLRQRTDLSLAHRQLLIVVLTAGRFYKHLRMWWQHWVTGR